MTQVTKCAILNTFISFGGFYFNDYYLRILMEPQNSILEKIINSKKTSDIEQFNPADVVNILLKNLTSREEDVLRRRHGLLGKEKETLENIGESYRVTRERIRQIENTGIKKIKKLKEFKHVVSPIENTVQSVLQQHGGVMEEQALMRMLLQSAGETSTNRQNILFIISELLNDTFQIVKQGNDYRQSWKLKHAPLHLLKETMNELYELIEKNQQPMQLDQIIESFKNTEFYQRNQTQLTDDVIASYIDINPRIAKNPFDEYGLSKWGSIVPKRMNDKIYLILKRHGKPLHFTEIAKLINEAKFDSRKAYPPTVHNELILNEKYVLVGRGIYALKEWGYKPGVVSNVLEDILKKQGQPMTRDELVKAVLEKRMVKKNTIHLALTDKTKFKKHSNGTYTLVVPEHNT